MSNSSLVSKTLLSPNCNSPRNNQILKITPHHCAGFGTTDDYLNMFANPGREASANYVIGSDHTIGLCVDEANRAWTSGSPENDNMAVTIEVANDGDADTGWHVSDENVELLIQLMVDICKRNGIASLNYTGDANGNLTLHKMFQATSCPGPYLTEKMPEIANEVNKRLGVAPQPTPTPQPTPQPTPTSIGINDFPESPKRRNTRSRINAIRVTNGDVWYQSRTQDGRMLGVITGCDINDFNYGFAGDDTPMATLTVYYTTPQDVINSMGYLRAKYRVHVLGGDWLDWQFDNETGNGQDGYAGIPGVAIDGLQITLE